VDKLIAGQFIHIGNELCRILLILESSGCFYASIHSVDEVGWEALFYRVVYLSVAFSALTLLVGQQEGHPACKKLWWGACLSGARCRLAYGPADATATYCLLLQ